MGTKMFKVEPWHPLYTYYNYLGARNYTTTTLNRHGKYAMSATRALPDHFGTYSFMDFCMIFF